MESGESGAEHPREVAAEAPQGQLERLQEGPEGLQHQEGQAEGLHQQGKVDFHPW